MIRKQFIFMFAVLGFLLPSFTFASTLTAPQIQSIILLLQAFNVDQATITNVQQILQGTSSAPVATSTPPVHVSTVGSPYPSSGIGYDISFNTTAYPVESFGFGVIGVTGGKAFVHNARLASEHQWAKFGATTAPTLYMNLNAPYGSTVAGHIGAPKPCPARTGSTTEPTACEGYNYGYNAAADAVSYATGKGLSSTLWWLDIEEANSWSPDTAVNGATIQGAIDYFNTQNIRVGIYSVPYMWRAIAGTSIPTQSLAGVVTPIPTWFPIGIASRVGAINKCSTVSSFIPDSPVWVVQYVADSTAVDQNLAC